MQIERLIREEASLDIQGITLLSIEEYEAYRPYIGPAGYTWWLRSTGNYSAYAACVGSRGYVDSYGQVVGYNDIAVRPALQITNLESANIKIGDKFCLFGYKWTVISKELALCDEVVGKHAFREDWQAEGTNDYEKSDVKRFLEEWFDERCKEEDEK